VQSDQRRERRCSPAMVADDGGSRSPDAPGARLTIIVDGANVVGSRPDGWWRDRAGAAVRLYDNLLKLASRGATGVSDGVLGTSGGSGSCEVGGLRRASGPRVASGPGGVDGAEFGESRPGGATALADARQAAEVVLVLEGAARAAVPQIAARARTAEGGHSPAPSGSCEMEGGPGEAGGEAGVLAARVRVVSAPGTGDDEIVRLVRSLPGYHVVVTADRELRRRCTAAGAEVTSPSWLYGLL
jgi:hypothetical protein